MKQNNRILFCFEWLKGLSLNIPNSKFINFSIGCLILGIAASLLIHVIAPAGLIH